MKIKDLVWTEKYRPDNFDDLILDGKLNIINYLNAPASLPSFLFYSPSPGTGKTTLARLIIKSLSCDSLKINASDERGIDTIRDKIKLFAMSRSSNGIKRCIFLDESDGMGAIAQDCLRSIFEQYSHNCFFILTANDISKIIEPIKSRCILVNFEQPDRDKILNRLEFICKNESLDYTIDQLDELIDNYYPDIRSMILTLQDAKINNKSIISYKQKYFVYLQAIKNKNIKYLYEEVYNGNLDINGFTKWLFRYIFDNYNKIYNITKIANLLAEIECHINLGANKEIIFLANILQIMDLL